MGPIRTVQKAFEIAKDLYDLSNRIKDAEAKALIADLHLAMAELKVRLAELEEENLTLRQQLTERREKIDRALLRPNNGAYWFRDAPVAGYEKGPYCTGCFDTTGKLTYLDARTSGPFAAFGKYYCSVCGKHAGNPNIPG